MGDRTKYAGLLFGITFTSFLVTFAVAYFSGMMTRSFALIADNPEVDIWVMDPAVESVDNAFNLPDSALDQVRNVDGVASASPLAVAQVDARLANGRFQLFELIGVDDVTMGGLPADVDAATRRALRIPGSVITDPGGSEGKLLTPSSLQDQWPFGVSHLDAPMRLLQPGDELLLHDHRARVIGESHALPRFPPRPLLFASYSTLKGILPPEREQTSFILVRAQAGVVHLRLAQQIEAQTGFRARTANAFESDTVKWAVAHSEDVGDAITMLTIALLVGFGVTGVMMFMFTLENLKYYALFNAMGASSSMLAKMIGIQALVAACLGSGLGFGLCALAGEFFKMSNFPFRLMWFAPLFGGLAVILVSLMAAAICLRPMRSMQPATVLTRN